MLVVNICLQQLLRFRVRRFHSVFVYPRTTIRVNWTFCKFIFKF